MQNLSPPTAWRDATVHSSYLRLGIVFAESLGIHIDVRKPEAGRMLPLLDVLPLLDSLDAITNPQIGMKLAMLIPASAHGSLGYSVVSSATIRAGMETIARYTAMRNRLFTYRCYVNGDDIVLSLKPRIPLAGYRKFIEITTSVSIFKMLQSLAGDDLARKMRIDVTWGSEIALSVPMKMHYSQRVTTLRVPLAFANISNPTADAKLYANACRSCEEELAVLDGSMASQLRAKMPDENQAWPSLKDAAQFFSVSPRTLIRRLVAEGVTYQALLDEAKGEMACWYLNKTSLPISSIADRLGFVDDANFSRSFRRWRGKTPLEYRKSNQVP
jgi:AraC-like DNA-binding protein